MDERLAALSTRTHGIFTRRQALEAGASRGLIDHRIATARWEVLARGVYRLNGIASTWRQGLLVACLVAGQGGVASHRSAAVLVGLAGIEYRGREITVERGKRRRPAGIVSHEASLPRVDVTVVDAIPATTVTRTLIDLGAVVTPDVLEEALDDALRRSLTSTPRLRWRLAELARRGRPGISVIRALLDARGPATVTPRSVLETRFVRLLRGAGLPPPVRQHEVRVRGRLVAVIDFAYPDLKVAIEVDGYRWHTGRARWEHDLARRNRVTTLGWRVIHVTDRDIDARPDRVVGTVAAALAQPDPR